MGGAIAQSSTSSGTSASGASGTSASGATPSGVTSDRKAPTTTTGPREVGGSDRARNTADFGAIDKNKDGQISRQEWNDYQRGAGAGATSASGGASGSTRADKAPTTTTGPRDTGGSDRRTTGSTAGATSSSGGATTGATTDKAPTTPTGPKDTGGTDKPMSTK
jgi:hypothetical protein